MDTSMSDSAEYETLQMSQYKKTFQSGQGEDQKMMEAEFQLQLMLYIMSLIPYKHP